MPFCFLMRDKKGVNPDGREGEELEELSEEIIISIYWMKNVFSIKEKRIR